MTLPRDRSRPTVRRGRRSPLATIALIGIGLFLTGGAYAGLTATSSATAAVDLSSPQAIAEGKKLFEANCASCHGLNLQGSATGPSLLGVGAAAVDFQVRTGRMPLVESAPQAPQKPPIFSDDEVKQLAAYVAAQAPGPGLPPANRLTLTGDATRGADLFRTNCAMCHNIAGAGGALTQGKYAPPLRDSAPETIYEAMLTGPQNMPVFNDDNITPQEKQDIITAIKYTTANDSVGGLPLGSLGPVVEGLAIWIFGLGSVIAFCVWLTAKAN